MTQATVRNGRRRMAVYLARAMATSSVGVANSSLPFSVPMRRCQFLPCNSATVQSSSTYGSTKQVLLERFDYSSQGESRTKAIGETLIGACDPALHLGSGQQVGVRLTHLLCAAISTAWSRFTVRFQSTMANRKDAPPMPRSATSHSANESVARVAYRQDQSSLATCEHLRPIERAMRMAGLELRLDSRLTVDAPCAIAEKEFVRRCRPGPTVHFRLHADSGRSYEDPPIASLTCHACGSLIYVVHPQAAVGSTPVFPSAERHPAGS